MKTMFQTIALTFLFIVSMSCKKQQNRETLDGRWEFRNVVGGMIAGPRPAIEKGNGYIWKFDGDKFEKYNNNKLVRSGTFTLTAEIKEINNNDANYYLMLSDNQEKMYINLSSKQLIIFFGVIAADGIEEHYEKL